MKTIYLVRHGESTENARTTEIYEGPDAELNERGRAQASEIAKRAERLPIHVVVSSTMRRARDTAQIIVEDKKLTVEYSDLFVERQTPSSLMGQPWEDLKFKESLRSWERTLYVQGEKIEDGENFDDIVMRAGKAFEYLSARPEEHILVVTHGFFLRVLLSRLMFGASLRPDELRKFVKATRTDNTGITVLTYGPVQLHAVDPDEERWMIRVYNDHAHLG